MKLAPMRTPPKSASIVIATFNRASYLIQCFEGLAALDTDTADFEIIVIDNNSQDNTANIIGEFAESHSDLSIRYILESRQGATLARNRGIEITRGELICFLDDDAVPSPDWLNAMIRSFSNPLVGCVGGPAILDFQGQKVPPWLRGDLKGLLSGYGLGYDSPTIITRVEQYPFLCNMAARSDILRDVGLFRTDLGPSGNKLVVGEETELIGRIREAGWTVIYQPEAEVRHLVAPERLRKQYIYRSAMRLSVTHIFLTFDRRIHMILRWLASDLWYATRMVFSLLLAFLRRKSLWFDDYMRFWMVAKRVPLRIRALIWGLSSIETPKAR